MGLAPNRNARISGETAVVRCLSQFFNTLLDIANRPGPTSIFEGRHDELAASSDVESRGIQQQVVIFRCCCIAVKVVFDEGRPLLVESLDLSFRFVEGATEFVHHRSSPIGKLGHQADADRQGRGQNVGGGPTHDDALAPRSERENRIEQLPDV
jgi:hypothetical protein